jgi:excisionase family DNA binding protein
MENVSNALVAGALLKVHDVAAQLNVTKEVLYDWCRSDVITHVRFGSRIRFRPEDVKKFIDERLNAGEVEASRQRLLQELSAPRSTTPVQS